MQTVNPQNITVDVIPLPLFAKKGIDASVLRTDKIHPVISGNKWFKLRYYLEKAGQERKTTIVTKGGAWSNHIVATAAACRQYNFKSIGIIRGEEPATLSATLQEARNFGMELVFINRNDFAANKLPQEVLGDTSFFIEYGGYGIEGARGAGTMLDYCEKEKFTHILCAVGSGTMLAGLVNAAVAKTTVTGICAMKNNYTIEAETTALLGENSRPFRILHDYHFGGFAKHTKELTDFMNSFYRQTHIPSDRVYTGKLFFAMADLAAKDYFPKDSKLLVIHSGGLQGNASLPKGTLIF